MKPVKHSEICARCGKARQVIWHGRYTASEFYPPGACTQTDQCEREMLAAAKKIEKSRGEKNAS